MINEMSKMFTHRCCTARAKCGMLFIPPSFRSHDPAPLAFFSFGWLDMYFDVFQRQSLGRRIVWVVIHLHLGDNEQFIQIGKLVQNGLRLPCRIEAYFGLE